MVLPLEVTVAAAAMPSLVTPSKPDSKTEDETEPDAPVVEPVETPTMSNPLAPLLAVPTPPVAVSTSSTTVNSTAGETIVAKAATVAVDAAPAPPAVSSAPTTDTAPAPAAPITAAAPPAPQPVAVAPAPPAEAAPRAQAPELATQLSRPLHGLRSLGDGNHVITISVTPENLGPVTVRAHVSGEAVRIELLAPSDQGREALKAIMPELRRDLSSGGGQFSLDLSSGNQPSGRQEFQREGGGQPLRSPEPASAPESDRRHRSRDDAVLDVLA